MPTPPSTLGETRLAKEQALARLRQLQTGQLEGRLLDREEVRSTLAQAFAALRDRALGMCDRIASRGAGRSAEGLRAVVDEGIAVDLEQGRGLINSLPNRRQALEIARPNGAPAPLKKESANVAPTSSRFI